jgi:hypothetical protein
MRQSERKKVRRRGCFASVEGISKVFGFRPISSGKTARDSTYRMSDRSLPSVSVLRVVQRSLRVCRFAAKRSLGRFRGEDRQRGRQRQGGNNGAQQARTWRDVAARRRPSCEILDHSSPSWPAIPGSTYRHKSSCRNCSHAMVAVLETCKQRQMLTTSHRTLLLSMSPSQAGFPILCGVVLTLAA